MYSWNLIFRQTHDYLWNTTDPRTDYKNKDSPDSNDYSIFKDIANFKNEQNVWHFRYRHYKNNVLLFTNEWKQSGSPFDPDSNQLVTGYEAINIETTSNGWGGITRWSMGKRNTYARRYRWLVECSSNKNITL